MTQNNKNLFKNKLLLFRSKSVRLEKMFPVSEIRRALPIHLQKIVSLSMGKATSLSSRIRIAHNFFAFVLKMNKHHGSPYTVKWLKGSQVALQKYLGGDRLKSLRSLEPNLPFPRLINGCPSIINKSDRRMIRMGNAGITRFWLSLFGSYRIMSIVGKTKLESIYSPFSGKVEVLSDLISFSRSHPQSMFSKLNLSKWKPNLSPRTIVLSHKGSPSNSMSYKGILSDFWLLTKGNQSQRDVYSNINSYLECISSVWSISRWNSLCHSLSSIIDNLEFKNLNFKKSADLDNGLSQFAIKEEAAGKIRVFALIDSISQSVLKPVHESLFSLLKLIPNDGTFNQDESVRRSIEKSKKSNLAYSFDLSSATDRLPRSLTGSILENLFDIKDFSTHWQSLMADRVFSFTGPIGKKYPHLLVDQDNKYRYSVGQPMGGLSSWAGLAITHHWILQYCSVQIGNYSGWNEDYEILGDDIVIFDTSLANKYLEVMSGLGVEINLTKSISSPKLPVFEFAKRTIVSGLNVSSISFQQLISQSSRGARVADSASWISQGLIKSTTLLSSILNKLGGTGDFRSVGLEAFSLLGLLYQKRLIEHRVVVESLINPRFKEDFDWDRAVFALPVRSILKYVLQCLNGIGESYPFSHKDLRREVYNDLETEMVAIILQQALWKAKLLNRDYDLLLSQSSLLVKGITDKIFLGGLTGFFEDLIINLRNDRDIGELVDDVEDTLYQHAKYPRETIESALKVLDRVEEMVFVFTYKTEISQVRYETETSPIIDLVRKGVWGSRTKYWELPNNSYS